MNTKYTQSGFTLIEVAIVFIIVAVLLTSTFMPLRSQKESNNISDARAELKRIEDALYGFAAANGRLPCPSSPNIGGVEDLNAPTPPNTCNRNHGFVPSNTLGIPGGVNCDGLLLDPWGRPYRYSITTVDSDANGDWDFVNATDITTQAAAPGGLGGLAPNLNVCWDLAFACPGAGTANVLSTSAVAVIYSTGRPRATSNASEDQNAGEGANLASSCGLAAYPMPNNNNFYAAKRREIVGQEFDDILIYISEHNLYSIMLKSGAL